MERNDSYRHKGLRKKLIDSIRAKGIKNEEVLEAMNRVPRHLFLDEAFLENAYVDQAFPIGEGQTISQPFTVAYQTTLLDPRPGKKVLEIGTGSGYQASILAELGMRVYTIERQQKLFKKTESFLNKLGYNQIKTFFGDGYKGLPAFEPFDKIIITAGATEIPEELVAQLKPGGILVAPLGADEVKRMVRGIKQADGQLEIEEWDTFKFVPFLKGKSW
jgi:protein-L-isoaspartate(D-aspartate) O-methyltransferase